MANANVTFGLRPINDNGTTWSGQGRMVAFPATQSSNIFLGDPIVPLGGTDAFGVPLVGIATAGAGNNILGGFIGIAARIIQEKTPFGSYVTQAFGTSGVGDWGNIGVMPVLGVTKATITNNGYWSNYSHNNEIATPGYYSVLLHTPSSYLDLIL